MIYLFTALHCEAHLFIRQFHLAKNQDTTWFQEFYNENAGIRLAVTGVGELAAAAVVASMCSMYRPAGNDLLLNVGTCAHATQNDGIFLCNQITEAATGKTFYPDMIYRHDFDEAAIVTGMRPWNGAHNGEMTAGISGGELYDMEAAAVYQAGIHFFGPHQMQFLKIVPDCGAAAEVSRENVSLLMEKSLARIVAHIEKLAAITQENRNPSALSPEEAKWIEKFCTDLHCSMAMRDSMAQYVQYLTLAKIDYISIIQDYYAKKQLPCKDKREGKRYFEEFKRKLF